MFRKRFNGMKGSVEFGRLVEEECGVSPFAGGLERRISMVCQHDRDHFGLFARQPGSEFHIVACIQQKIASASAMLRRTAVASSERLSCSQYRRQHGEKESAPVEISVRGTEAV